MGVGRGRERGRGGGTNLLFLVALFAEVLAATGHFSAAHGVFFGCEVFLNLYLCSRILVWVTMT
jgi:hypothetical protein